MRWFKAASGDSMSLDTDDIKSIAKLARLKIDEADMSLYATNLSNILDLVEQMNSVNTEGVVPMSHPLEVVQRLREDVVTESNQRDEFQSVAPATQDGLYLVPKVIE
jgi:aspartyl-tRNA(Asn)/glutamyl-tRNA(Gln) amidotransferase subunit C